jgi:hypothetical protein
LRCPKAFEGELNCGEGGRAVPEAVEILRRWNCETVASLFIVDGGNGAGEAGPVPTFGDELSIANANSGELYAQQRKCAISNGVSYVYLGLRKFDDDVIVQHWKLLTWSRAAASVLVSNPCTRPLSRLSNVPQENIPCTVCNHQQQSCFSSIV